MKIKKIEEAVTRFTTMKDMKIGQIGRCKRYNNCLVAKIGRNGTDVVVSLDYDGNFWLSVERNDLEVELLPPGSTVTLEAE